MQEEILEGYRLAPQQRHLWEALRYGRNGAYQTKCAVAIKGRLESRHLRTAAEKIVARHEILRTSFQCLPGMTIPMQVINETGVVVWREADLSGLDERAWLIEYFFAGDLQPFDFEQGPFLLLHLIKKADDDYALLVRLPAICADLVSIRNLVGELCQEYEAAARGEELDRDVIQYADLAEWQNDLIEAEEMQAARDHWRRRALPHPSTLQLAFESAPAGDWSFEPHLSELVITPYLAALIESSAQSLRTSVEQVLLCCWYILLWRHTGQSEIEVGIAFDGRRAEEVEDALGLFAKYLPITCHLEEGLRFGELIELINKSLETARNWQEYFSWEQLVDSSGAELRPSFTPFCFETETPLQTFLAGDVSFAIFRQFACLNRFKIKLSYAHRPDGLVVTFHYDSQLFRSEDIRSLIGQYQTLLENGAARLVAKIGQLEIVGEAERRQLLFGYNSTKVEWPEGKTVHELFVAQQERTPEAIAAIYEDQQLTYRELNERAARLARYLLGLGVGPEVIVGICMERSLDMIVSLLAILKAGGSYLPLDPSYPLARLSLMLEDAAVTVLLTQTRLRSRFSPAESLRIECVDALWEELSQAPARDCETMLSPDNLAYVIYTSGATGRPKGVMLRHGSLTNYLLWAINHYPVGVGFGAPVHSSLSFDLTITALFPPLLVGGHIHLLPTENEIEALTAAFSRRSGYSLVKLTPAHLQLLAEQLGEIDLNGAARSLVIGGENLSAQAVSWWSERAPAIRLFNEYGPTESVVGCSVYEVGSKLEVEKGRAVVPIGKPIANTRLYLLDERQQLTSYGAVGELYIAGDGLARGYLNQPDLTAERFVPEPYSGEPGTRRYHTGDLARYLRDGHLDCIGRVDDQVKIRGYRIELGEIEAVLRTLPGVREAVAIATSEDGQNRLIGYVVGDGDWRPDIAQSRRCLREHLPEYMVPAALITLDALPLTANGKIDRKRLSAMPLESLQKHSGWQSGSGDETRTPTEEIVAGIFKEVLRLDQVGKRDNFFQIGGHSLLATQVASRVRGTFGVEIGVKGVFKDATVEGLATQIEAAMNRGEKAVGPLLVRAPRDSQGDWRPPLSFAQQRLWFIDQLEPGNPVYNIPGAVILEGPLNLQAFERAINEIVRRHEALRTRFEVEAGKPAQVIDAWEPRSLEVEDLTAVPAEERAREIRLKARDEARRSFDLRRGPLMRIKALKLEEEKHVTLFTMHHIVSDAWSMGVLVRELGELYKAFSEGQASPLPELEIQYADYAVWQREYLTGEALESEIGYWKAQLQGAAVMDLPTDRIRPATPSHRGSKEKVRIDREIRDGLRKLSQREGATLFMVLMAAFKTLLMRYSGEEDLSVGTAIANRTRRETEGLIGFFVNTLVMRTNLGGNPCFKELIEREREVALGAYARQEAPFEKLVEEINPERDLSRSPLFQVMMVLQNAKQEDLDLRGLKISGIGGETEVAKFDLTLILIEGETGISGYLEYSRDLYDSETVMRMVEHFEHVVKEVVEDSERRIQEIELLSESEKRQIVEEWNATEAPYGKERLIHELFEEQAATTSDAVAVAHEDCHLSYNDLNVRANRLARYLRTLNARPDARVALCLERGPDMIVSLLAILKAGGAYVPLDPAYPTERLGYMLEDSAPVAILTHNHVASQAQATILATSAVAGVPVIDLQADAARWASEPDTDPDPEGVGLTPEHLAYVIYTSGSTGLPKGVAIEHRNTVNLIRWAQRAFAGDVLEKTLFSTSLNFDLAVYECFVPLTVGGGVRIVSDALELARQAVDVTLINTVPSAMKALVEGNKIPPTVRMVNLAGDQLKRELVERIFETTDTEEVRNLYGPSETTTYSTWVAMRRGEPFAAHIGRPIANTRVYILDGGREPAPAGVIGEIHIGGAGVARGYLNRVDLTAERFVQDPFSQEAGARMYRTGDLGRWLADGTIEFLGRNDFQVKLRGFRIELGEIEARLASHPAIKEAVALAREDSPGDKRLVAYYTTADAVTPGPDAEALRGYLLESLPEYMAPAAYVKLDALPLTPNGKLDRRALPTPEDKAYVRRGYEPPVGGTEIKLAGIWADLLKLERVGRQDNFFELGGHSLLAISMIERMRRDGLPTEVRTLFAAPTLRALAEAIEGASPAEVKVPPNLIPAGCGRITPEMLPLVELTQPEIDTIVAGAPGGAPNVQDIYPLAPLQEGILFHHLMNARGDAYLLHSLLAFDTRERLDSVLSALRQVIARHDILRTALVWEGLPEPVQVVWREALLTVEEITLDPSEGEVADQLLARFDPRRIRLDLSQAPLMRCIVTTDAVRGRWLLLWLSHHLTTDHMALEVMIREAQAALLGEIDRLPAPLPFRNLVAQARMRRERREDEEFFREMLGSVEEPTAPYGLLEVQGDGSEVEQARVDLDATLARRLKERAREMGVSAASVCHVAWGRVVGRVTGREDVVFGTVLFGRMGGGGEGAERVLGLFINTLPIRVGVGRESVERSVRRTQEALGGLMSHEHASLAVAQRCSGVKAPAPLFSCLLNYRHSQREVKRSRVGREAWVGMEALESGERTNYPLTLSVDDLGDGFGLTAQAIRPIDAGRICEYMRKALEGLVEALERAPETEVRWIEVVPEGERRQILEEWNETEAEYPRERCVHELFEEQVERSPEAVALVYEDRQLSYGELNARANRLARHLRSLGVGPECRVAICLERSVELVVGLLGVLKAGGAYVPLDPSYPPNRLTYMVKDCAPAILLTHEATSALTVELASGLLSLNLDSDAAEWGGQFDNKLSHAGTEPAPENPAYVIYTSGSTGQPKGVMVNHYGVVNLLCSMRGVVNAASTDCVPVLTTIGFDIAGLEIYLPLICGARAILVDQAKSHDPKALAEAMAVSGATLVQATPAAWRMLLDSGWPGKSGLKVLCGGEALPIELAGAVRERVGALWNVYGPTETTIWSSAAQVGATRSTCIVEPIGRPIANTQIYILDERYEPSPIKVAGEIYIGGAGVARGYLKRPDLTAERFLPDPYTQQPGASFYRTGDLGRWLPEGDIEFLGRNDFQVKIRGFRIELGEIEARLAAHDGVREAVVAPREEGEVGKMLVAYYTGAEVGAEALRVHLSSSLPEYMVPAAYVHLEMLPLTPNGKLDRRALPAPNAGKAGERGEYLAPQTPVEEIAVGIFEEVLKLGRVGRRDNFFELGGHSLLATQVISRVRKAFGVEIGVKSMFENATVEGLARSIEEAMRAGAQDAAPPLARVSREGQRIVKLPPSFAQQRLWFLDQLAPNNPFYNIPGAVRLEGRLNLGALERAVNEIVRRHEVLRTRFEVEAGAPVQFIDQWEPRRLDVEDLTGLAPEERELEVSRRASEEAAAGFDLSRGPLLRVKVLKLGKEDHVLLYTMHHIVSDEWSMGILIKEVGALYRAFNEGTEPSLRELPIQYADYAVWQRNYLRGEALERQMRYWHEQLAGMEELELPTDHPRPAVSTYRGAGQRLVVKREVAEKLRALGQQEGVTMFMMLLGGFDVLMSRYSGQIDILLGTDIASRNRAEIEGLIGFFVNQLVLRVEVNPGENFSGLIRRVRKVCLGAYTYQDMPFEKLVEELQPERDLGRSPLFQVKLILRNAPREELKLGGARLLGIGGGETQTAKFDLTMAMTDTGGDLIGGVEYSLDLFEAETIERLIGHYANVLQEIVEGGGKPIRELKLLSDREREQIVVEWNETGRPFPQERSVHQLFAEQAEQTPDRIALIGGLEQVSYVELNLRANQLGHYLQKLGVGPEVVVGLCLERSTEMVVAMMGVLKAGGAYLPLDPQQPLERLSFMLKDARVGMALTREKLKDSFPTQHWGQTVLLDEEWERIGEQSREEPKSVVGAENLAYVIYTSGSTGEPKGVLIRHGGLASSTCARFHYYSEPVHSFLLVSPFSFDSSVAGIYWTLCQGGTLLLPSERLERDPVELARLIAENDTSHLLCLPTLYSMLLMETEARQLRSMKCVIVAGEACQPEVIERHGEALAGVGLFNEYGPTEGTVWSTAYGDCAKEYRVPVPIGKPIEGAQLYILDRELEPVSVGVRGEIYISGAGLARGYLGKPELTAERFIASQFGGSGGGRMYRTGDVGCYLSDGNIEFLGRADGQVKVRGYRIELGEIEAVLNRHSEVKQSVVVASEDKRGGTRLTRLVGYVVVGGEVVASELKRHVRERLPEYMVPEAIQIIEEMPLNANGKIDRKRLPAVEGAGRREEEGEVVPRTPIEEILIGIFEEVLKVERVGREDNFFEIGGHSLLASQVISRVRNAFGVEIGVGSVFEQPTVEGLGRRVEEAMRAGEKDEAPPLVRVGRDRRLPLSYAQQRLWFIDQLEPGNAVYNCPGAVKLTGELNLEVLERVINEILRRHEVLRTRINVVEGEPTQVIDEWEPRTLPVEDLTSLTPEEKEETISRLASEDAAMGFDLRRGPLLRMKMLKLGEEEHVALFTMHHIVSDGWSMGILIKEVKALYEAYCAGEESPLEELPIQYADFAVWQRSWIRGEVLENQLSYWKRQLAGKLPVLELPTDKPRLAIQTYRMGERSQMLPTMLSDLLKALGLEQSCTLFMTLLSAFNILLYYLTGQTDICIGTTIANRNRAEIQKLIGFFINQLVLRTELSPNSTFKELLGKVREISLGAYAHQDLPFEKLVEALNPKRDANRTPLFQVKMVLHNAPVEELSLPGLKLSPIATTTDTAKFDLLLNLNDTGRGLRASLQYNSDLFEERTPIRILNRFQTLLDRIVERPDARLQELVESLIEQDEREQEEKKGELKATRRRRLKNINGKATAEPYAEAEHRKDNLSHGAEQIRPITVRRKPFSVVRESLVTIEPQKGEESLPLVMRPSVEGVDLVAWAPSNREFIKAQLLKHGGILFRNFNISSPSEFERFATACSDELLPYREPSSPRTLVRNNIYTSTDYPADQSIFLHNEHSYRHTWPLKIFFFCLEPPAQGGETPIADCRKVFKRIDPKIRRRFIEKGWMLVRNFGAGLSLTWQSVFQTEDKSAVEAYCREAGIETEWRGERLRTRQARQAVAQHPSTGEMVWFNHATFFHVSTLEPSTREVLLGGLEEEDLPANTYYGDGRPIEHSVLEEIREAYRRETVSFAWQEGDILMLDNMLVAHGRNPYVGRRRILVAMAEQFSPIATTLR